MKRRLFLQTFSTALAISSLPTAALSQQETGGMKRPRPLKEGSVIGIIAPGTAVSDPDDLASAAEALNYFGLEMKFGKNVAKGSGYKTRTIDERLDDLHEMFDDNNIDAVFAVRGGYGSAQLLDKIDYRLIKNNPKIFLGYSDITALHLAINRYSELVTFHGPVLLSVFSNYTAAHFRKALFDTAPLGFLQNPDTNSGIRKVNPLRTIVPGKAKGKLIGGNLTLVSTLMGTPYEIDTKDKIVLLEDVGEKPYSIDRMITQLRLAGKLESAAGIIIGNCNDCAPDGSQSSVWDSTLGEVLDNILGDLKIPVIYGLMFGHTSDQLTLPLGIEASLDSENKTFEILESGVL